MSFRIFVFVVVLLGSVLSASAQDALVNTVTFNGYGFSYSDNLPTDNLAVNITRYAGDPPDMQKPGGRQPAHTRFDLYTDSVTPNPLYNDWTDVTVRFYKAADAGYSYTLLKTYLDERPVLASTAGTSGNNILPFLVSVQGIPIVNARPQYVETERFTGVSYIVHLSLAVGVIGENGYVYTFQGISNDGSTYVSLVAKLHTLVLPTADPDYFTFAANFESYLAEAVSLLDAASPDQFEPNLDDLDAFVRTITVK